MFKKYFKPKSVTWWAGMGMLVKAVATSVIEKRVDVQGFMEAAGLIGLRGALN